MYTVTIITDGQETIIHQVNTNRITGSIKLGINTIDSFTFTIYPNNPGYYDIFPYRTLIKVFNEITKNYDFIGRVLTHTGNMTENGLISKTYVCESELGYLCDSCQIYGEYHNISPLEYLTLIINNHNNMVTADKRFKIGNITVQDNNDSMYKYLAYDTTWKNIQDDLIETLGGEIKIRYEGSDRYIDYLSEIGRTCTTEIKLGKNIKTISNDIDPSTYYTRLIPLGAKKTIQSDDGTTDTPSEERLTIADVNNGIIYIDDEESIQEFGIITGVQMWDDVTSTSNLFRKGREYLTSQKIGNSIKITALDLALINLSIDTFEVGNYYPVLHELLNVNTLVRIVEKTININHPEQSTITIGDKTTDVKTYQLNIKKQTKKINDINHTLNNNVKILQEFKGNTTRKINTMNDEMSTINEDIGTLNNGLRTTNLDISDLWKLTYMGV